MEDVGAYDLSVPSLPVRAVEEVQAAYRMTDWNALHFRLQGHRAGITTCSLARTDENNAVETERDSARCPSGSGLIHFHGHLSGSD